MAIVNPPITNPVVKVNGVPVAVRSVEFIRDTIWAGGFLPVSLAPHRVRIEVEFHDGTPYWPPRFEVILNGKDLPVYPEELKIRWDVISATIVADLPAVAPATPPTLKEFDSGNLKTFQGRLRGYRYFRLNLGKDALRSVARGTVWTTEMTASCYTGHPAPQPGCRCGLYSWYTPEDALRNHIEGRFGVTGDRLVLGVIAASGNVVPGTEGFKTERATIEALRTDNAGLKKKYPEVEFFKSQQAMLKKFPPEGVSELMK